MHTRRAVKGWGVNILENVRHRIGLLQYNLSTMHKMHMVETIDSPYLYALGMRENHVTVDAIHALRHPEWTA